MDSNETINEPPLQGRKHSLHDATSLEMRKKSKSADADEDPLHAIIDKWVASGETNSLSVDKKDEFAEEFGLKMCECSDFFQREQRTVADVRELSEHLKGVWQAWESKQTDNSRISKSMRKWFTSLALAKLILNAISDDDNDNGENAEVKSDSLESLKEEMGMIVAELCMPSQVLIQPPKERRDVVPDGLPSNHHTSSRQDPDFRVHAKQQGIAKKLYNKICEKVDPAKFDDFKFVFILPPLNTLMQQTIERLQSFVMQCRTEGVHFSQFSRNDTDKACAGLLFKTGLKESGDNFQEFLEQQIKPYPRTLLLCIHDEAHWGATMGGLASTYLRLCEGLPNVIVLQVSGTPYNLQTKNTNIPLENEVDWLGEEDSRELDAEDEPSTPLGVSTQYYGLREYLGKVETDLEQGSLTYDNEFEELTRESKYKKDKRVSRTDALLKQYVRAMGHHALQPDPYDDRIERSYAKMGKTFRIMGDLLRGKDPVMIVLKCANNTQGSYIASVLRQAQNKLNLKQSFAIIHDMDKGSGKSFKSMKDQIGKILLDLYELNDQRLETYSDLKGLPCILILCEKGKMGDTFPASFRYYDLRLRYPVKISDRASFDQDLGRAFGYGENRPAVIVSRHVARKVDGHRNQTTGLFALDPPDTKMMKIVKNNRPLTSEAEGPGRYRKEWKASPMHFDYERSSPCDRFFLLYGRPQIGKTGAYLHLVRILRERISTPDFDYEVELADCDEEDTDGAAAMQQEMATVGVRDPLADAICQSGVRCCAVSNHPIDRDHNEGFQFYN